MRTTLSIDDDVFHLVAQLAEARGMSLGKAVSELVRRGFDAPLLLEKKNGTYVAKLPPSAPSITNEQVLRLKDELS